MKVNYCFKASERRKLSSIAAFPPCQESGVSFILREAEWKKERKKGERERERE